MTGNIRYIKNRIESIKSTKQITNAMKMVAAAKLRRAQDRILKARPYADHINQMIKILKYKGKNSEHPLLCTSSESKEILIILTSDRGLCGSFNSNIIRQAMKYIHDKKDTDLICIGKKGADYLKKRTGRIIDTYKGIFNEMDFSVSKEIAAKILNFYLDKKYSAIKVIYNEFKSAIQQNIIIKDILPITIFTADNEISMLDYIYEPDQYTIIDELGKKYVNIELWRMLLESSAAEQGARMLAMDSATNNATELIKELTLYYNRARQARITKEIIEISSGAEAINK
ncbi:MAG: ATP synthase F1 subunit gamma [Candidatus Cloacimonetes bacterium]|nr:ATP synthase F1 subunit gamma [Candidatus Cloacimonadota bacterium]